MTIPGITLKAGTNAIRPVRMSQIASNRPPQLFVNFTFTSPRLAKGAMYF